jgi:hypothetical protein
MDSIKSEEPEHRLCGLETRSIKHSPMQQMLDLRAGRGMGLLWQRTDGTLVRCTCRTHEQIGLTQISEPGWRHSTAAMKAEPSRLVNVIQQGRLDRLFAHAP